MQSVTDIGNDSSTALVEAKQLRELTISKAELAKRQKANVLDQLMSSMVSLATEQGLTQYDANLNPNFDATLLAEIVDDLKKLGYEVTTEAKSHEKLGASILLTIKW